MYDIKYIIYCYILGDSFGLSKLNNYTNEKISLEYNEVLNIEKGCFSSLSTFMLATMDSININKDIIPVDILNKMCTSLIVGKYTNKGRIYDLDKTTIDVLKYYKNKNNLNYDYDESDLSSYSISRLLPLTLYYNKYEENFSKLVQVIGLTTSNEEVILGNYILYKFILNLLKGKDKYKALKIDIPNIFSNKSKNMYKDILKGNIYFKEIKFDDNIINVIKIIFYIVLNSDNFNEVFMMVNSLEGNTNLYFSYVLFISGIIYGKDEMVLKMIKDIKNKKEINKYIKDFEKVIK